MKKKPFYILISALMLLALTQWSSYAQTAVDPVSSQEVFEHFDQLYKIDARLINGDFYNTPRISATAGHPFFINPDWKSASVRMEGIDFDDLQMRYDIGSGQVILNTADFTNSAVQLVLKKDRIDHFTLDGRVFQPFPEDDPMTGIRFCEVLEDGTVDLLLVKSKHLKVTTTGNSDFAYHTKETEYLRIGEELHPYLSRRSLIKIYPDFKVELKAYLKQNKLRLRKMSLLDHSGFVKYCNSLIESTNG